MNVRFLMHGLVLGVYSEELNKSQHLKLASLAEKHDKNSAFGREAIFHLYEAGDFKAALALATQAGLPQLPICR